MKYPTTRYVFDRRKKCVDSPRTARGYIEVEVGFGRRRKWLSTGVAVTARQWDAAKRIVNHPDGLELNMRIESFKKPIDDYIKLLMIKEQPFTFEGLAACLERKSNKGSFIVFVENRIEEQTGIKPRTKMAHRKLVSALRRFKHIETFDSLTRANVMAYDEWLHKQNYVQPTIHTYHKLLRRYVNEALARELIQNDPYAGMRIEKGKSKTRKFLTEEEIGLLRDCQGLPATLDRVRDLFIFQCFTGLAYADLAHFDFTKTIERNGKHVIIDQRLKSGEDYYIVLLPQALDILRKYNFRLPVISNQQYNLRLKVVADYAGLERNLTTHMARHSFLTMALNYGIPIETVSKMAGHTNIQTTQEYAKLLNKSVESAFDELEKKLK